MNHSITSIKTGPLLLSRRCPRRPARGGTPARGAGREGRGSVLPPGGPSAGQQVSVTPVEGTASNSRPVLVPVKAKLLLGLTEVVPAESSTWMSDGSLVLATTPTSRSAAAEQLAAVLPSAAE